MNKKNKMDELLQKGLRRRYFRNATIKDVVFEPMIFNHKSRYHNASLSFKIFIGLHSIYYDLEFKKRKKVNKWLLTGKLDVINDYVDAFNKTKDAKQLMLMAKELHGWLDEDEDSYHMRSFVKILEKITFNKLSCAMMFGLLTKEGYTFVKNLTEKYTSLNVEFDKMMKIYTDNAKDLQIIERWSGGYDLIHAMPSLERSLEHTLAFLNKMVVLNGGDYEA